MKYHKPNQPTELVIAQARIRELEKALEIAEEALYWHGGMAFELDGKIVGQVITNLLHPDQDRKQ